jgi:Domain of unknown function (DUF4465)/PEP-CTERM motif
MRYQYARHLPTLALLLPSLLFLLPKPCAATTVGFEDVSANLPIGGNYYYDGADGAGGFVSRGAKFSNSFTDWGGGFTSWDGWAYSQTTDTTTAGFTNQYSAFAGGGVDGSATYGVGFPGGGDISGITNITLDGERLLDGAYFTNSTYSALSMLDGDAFAKKFGGASGNDPDWFLLTISGFDAGNAPTGSVDVYLADYRFADNSLDYVLDSWQWVDLTGLGAVHSLDFSLSGSDVGDFGLNTPAYFAMDNLVVIPEPASGALLALGLAALGVCGRRRRA